MSVDLWVWQLNSLKPEDGWWVCLFIVLRPNLQSKAKKKNNLFFVNYVQPLFFIPTFDFCFRRVFIITAAAICPLTQNIISTNITFFFKPSRCVFCVAHGAVYRFNGGGISYWLMRRDQTFMCSSWYKIEENANVCCININVQYQ